MVLRRGIVVLGFVVSLFFLVGCAASRTQVERRARVVKAPPNTVAQADDCYVTEKELKEALGRTFFVGRAAPQTVKVNIAKGMLSTCLLAKEARKEGITLTPDEKRYLENMKNRMLVREYFKKYLQEHPITDQEIKAYYEKNKNRYVIPKSVKVRHIVVKDKALAQRILKRLKKGANFAQLAKKYNIDGTGPRGGELGWIRMGFISPPFSQAAFKLKKGEISGIVKDSRGYHIIQVEDVRPRRVRTLAEVKGIVKRELEMERYRKLTQEMFKKYPLKINQEVMEKIQVEGNNRRIILRPR